MPPPPRRFKQKEDRVPFRLNPAWIFGGILDAIIRVFPGLVLCAGGILKVHQFLFGLNQNGMPFPVRAMPAVAAAEVLIGLHLLFGIPRQVRVFQYVAFALFSAFVGINTHEIYMGKTTCRCFGALSIPNVLALGLDASGAMCVLIAVIQSGSKKSTIRTLARALLTGGVFLFAAFLATAFLTTSSFGARVRAAINRDAFVVTTDPSVINARRHEIVSAKIALENISRKAVTLLGTEGQCGLQFDTDFPIRVEPYSIVSIIAKTKAKNVAQHYVVSANVLTDNRQNPAVPVTVSIHVR